MSQAVNVVSYSKVKTVASQLVRQWKILMHSECNIELFANLLKKNVSTREIHDFVSKQSLHR